MGTDIRQIKSAIGVIKDRLAQAEQNLIAALIRGFYRIGVGAFRLLPPRAMLAIGSGLGRFIGGFCGRELSFSLAQLSFAFAPEPGASDAQQVEPRHVALKAFAHAGEYLTEVHLLDKLLPLVANGSIATFDGAQVIDELLLNRTPCVCIGSHVGPFEFSAGCMAYRGIPVTVFAQNPQQQALKPLLAEVHASAGFQVIWRDDQGAAAKILRCIKDGRALCALIDQDTTLENRFTPLFGLPAAHPVLPIKLAIKYDLPIIICSVARTERMRYHIRYQRVRYDEFLAEWEQSQAVVTPDSDPPPAPKTGPTVEFEDAVTRDPTIEEQKAAIEETTKMAEAAIKANTSRAVARIEAAIDYVLRVFAESTERELRAHPEQWYWWHRRWRRRPGVDYALHPEALRSSTEYLMWLEEKRALKTQGKKFDAD